MIITATQKNTRQTALKVRMVANQVKNLPLKDAVIQLGVIERKASLVILKTLRQAIANATHNHGYSVEELTLKSITVAPGPTYKRFRAVSRGRAHNIFKRTCHITVQIEAGAAPKVVEKKAESKEAAKTETTTKKTVKKTTKKTVKATEKKAAKKKTVKKETKPTKK